MTPSECAKLVGLLMAAFPHSKATPETSEVYEAMMADLDFVVAQKAVHNLLATARFLPTIAEIRGAVVDAQTGPVVPALVAWGAVSKLAATRGADRRPRDLDALTAACVDALGGWRYLCRSENFADQKNFCQLYGELRDQRRGAAVRGELPAATRPKLAQGPAGGIGGLVGGIGNGGRG